MSSCQIGTEDEKRPGARRTGRQPRNAAEAHGHLRGMSLRNLRRGLAATHPAVFGVSILSNGLGYAAGAAASSSVKPRVLFGSTGMPGPIVVVNVTFFR